MITQEQLLEELRVVMDPDVHMSIMDLGLVYRAEVFESHIEIDFTLTYPGCPLGDHIKDDIVKTAQQASGLEDVRAEIVWDPPWSPEKMSEEARLMLGYPI
jgi:metal-sulfur cluster biosynthetic enzyme